MRVRRGMQARKVPGRRSAPAGPNRAGRGGRFNLAQDRAMVPSTGCRPHARPLFLMTPHLLEDARSLFRRKSTLLWAERALFRANSALLIGNRASDP